MNMDTVTYGIKAPDKNSLIERMYMNIFSLVRVSSIFQGLVCKHCDIPSMFENGAIYLFVRFKYNMINIIMAV